MVGGRRAALASGLASAAAGLVVAPAFAVENQPMAYSSLLEQLAAKKISSAIIAGDGKSVVSIGTDGTRYETAVFDAGDLIGRMRAAGVTFELAETPTDIIGPLSQRAPQRRRGAIGPRRRLRI